MKLTEFNALVNTMVNERDYVSRAANIVRRLSAEIKKTGGERQRSDGVKWLRRIECRLMQRLYLGEYGSIADKQ